MTDPQGIFEGSAVLVVDRVEKCGRYAFGPDNAPEAAVQLWCGSRCVWMPERSVISVSTLREALLQAVGHAIDVGQEFNCSKEDDEVTRQQVRRLEEILSLLPGDE